MKQFRTNLMSADWNDGGTYNKLDKPFIRQATKNAIRVIA